MRENVCIPNIPFFLNPDIHEYMRPQYGHVYKPPFFCFFSCKNRNIENVQIHNVVYIHSTSGYLTDHCCPSLPVQQGTSVQEIQTSPENIIKINSAGEREFTFTTKHFSL